MQEIDLWDHLKQLLLNNISSAKPTSGGKEVKMICNNPDCNDKSGHLYIGMKNGIPMRHCKKNCGNAGVVSVGFLNSLGIYDNDINLLINQSKKISYKDKISYVSNQQRKLYVIKNDYVSNTKLSELKLAFINKRLGTNLNFKDLMDLKIVLNLHDLLNRNNIKEFTRYPNIVDELNKSFIGFISSDNSRLNMRNLREGKVLSYVDKRYINYNLFKDSSNTSSYVIPTSFDLNREERTKIHVAEGPFDILSVYLNLRNREEGVYKSLLGNNYLSLIEYILFELKLFYSEVHIYRDLGVDYEIFTEISNLLSVFNIPVYLHTNTSIGEKDFGVSPDRIIENIIKL